MDLTCCVHFGTRENNRGQRGGENQREREMTMNPDDNSCGSRRQRPHENHASLVSYFAVIMYEMFLKSEYLKCSQLFNNNIEKNLFLC